MLQRFALLFVCAILPLSLASADGFPSRPTFSTTTVRSTAPSINVRNTAATSGEQYWRLMPTGGTLELSACADNGTLCNDFFYFSRQPGTSTINQWIVSTAGLINISSSGSNIQLDTASEFHITADSGAFINLLEVPKSMWARITGGAGGCSINGSFSNNGVTSCSRTSTGVYEIGFDVATGFSETPVCVGTGVSAQIINIVTNGITSATVNIRDAAGTLMDSHINLQCMGR